MPKKQMDSALRCGLSFLETYSGTKAGSRPFQVLRRVLNYCKEHSTDADDDIEFTWKDIADRVDHEGEGKSLKKHLRAAIDLLDELKPGLNQIALDSGYEYVPSLSLRSSGTGSGNLNRYLLHAEPAQTQDLIKKSKVPKGFIRYTLETIDKPNWRSRWIDGLVAKGWIRRFIVSLVCFGIPLAALVFWFGVEALVQQTSVFGVLKTIVIYGILEVVIYFTISLFYNSIVKRIIMAPTSIAPFNRKNYQLEYIRTGEAKENGIPVRKLRLVSYGSVCPLCGGRIEVENHTILFNSRLVGRCYESPREHVFSFDHITRLGRPIYKEYQVLLDSSQAQSTDSEKIHTINQRAFFQNECWRR